MPRLLKELSYLRRSKLSIVTLLAPVFLVCSIAIVAYKVASRNIASSESVTRSYTVIQEIDGELRNLLDVESSGRGYVITGSADQLQSYDHALGEIQNGLKRIRALTVDDPTQQAHVTELDEAVALKLAHVRRLIEERKTSGPGPAMELVTSGEGKNAMDRIRIIAARMENQERRLLSLRREQTITSAYHVQLASIAFLFADLVVFAAMLAFIVRISRLQNLVKVCAWTKRIEYQGRWLRFEDYLYERFGIKTTHGMSEDAVDRMKAELEALPGTKR